MGRKPGGMRNKWVRPILEQLAEFGRLRPADLKAETPGLGDTMVHQTMRWLMEQGYVTCTHLSVRRVRLENNRRAPYIASRRCAYRQAYYTITAEGRQALEDHVR